MLILFDIDGTLLLTQGAGIAAMLDAGRELFGPHFTREGVEFSGRLDTLIWADLAALNKIDDHEQHHERFRAAYGRHLQMRLNNGHSARLLPGVKDLVERLRENKDFTLGLLTGNYPETGRLKINSAGLDPDVFEVAAWGCDAPTRRDLPPIALRHCQSRTGRCVQADDVVIIGDTPHDIDCAKAHGCRSIGVATGVFPIDALRKAGADLALADLSQTGDILGWLRQPSG